MLHLRYPRYAPDTCQATGHVLGSLPKNQLSYTFPKLLVVKLDAPIFQKIATLTG